MKFCFVIKFCAFSHRLLIFNPKIDEIQQRKFGLNIPTVTELERKTSIAFVNTNPTFNIPMPLPENVIPIGGMHIRDTKPLDKVS